MAKQFSIIATDLDCAKLEEVLKQRGDVYFLSIKCAQNSNDLLALDSIVIPSCRAGKESLFCLMVPKNFPKFISIKRLSEVKVSVDLQESYVIDFWIPFFDGKIIRPGRLYYQNRKSDAAMLDIRHAEFCEWADQIFKIVKKVFRRNPHFNAYVGPDAERKIGDGSVFVKW